MITPLAPLTSPSAVLRFFSSMTLGDVTQQGNREERIERRERREERKEARDRKRERE